MPSTAAKAPVARTRLAALCALVALLTPAWGARSAAAEEVRSLALFAGVFNVSKEEKSAEVGLEMRVPTKTWKLVVALGGAVTEDGAYYAFGGLRRDFSLGRGWQVTPGFGISVYEQGDGKNLGGPIEFRSILELSHQWPSHHRLAMGMYHLSNAGIYDLNPGANSVILTYSFPLGGAGSD